MMLILQIPFHDFVIHAIHTDLRGSLTNFVVFKISLLTTPHFQFRGVGQDIKQTYLWYPLFQAQCYRCYNLEHVDDISFREITRIILESKCGNPMWK